jgi:molecular chaperone GrpE
MTSESEKAPQDEAPQASGEQPTAEAASGGSASAASPSTPPPASGTAEKPAEQTPEQKLAEAQAEAARLRDQLLRTAADFDNFRKRARREEADATKRGKEGLLKDLLPVFDNLERAVQHADGAQDAKAVASGLRMVLKQFVDTLEKGGIKRVAAVGQPFDPTRHEAIQQLPSKDYPAGVVMAEVQPGYMMGDSLVRAALVVVSKGAPEESPAS